MCAKLVSDPMVPGARCPARVQRGLPCPGRLLPVRDAWPVAVAASRLRCNGPDAHVVAAGSPATDPPRPVTPHATVA
jgi:hypothetical protein